MWYRGAGFIITRELGEKTQLLVVLGKEHHKWSVPKGRSKNAIELPIDCAYRELKEETGISEQEIEPSRDNKIIYGSYIFYYAKLLSNRCSFDIQDTNEIEQVTWKDIDEIQSYKSNASLKYIQRCLLSKQADCKLL